MTVAVRKLVDSFSALPANERHQATVEILRRGQFGESGEVSDECLLDSVDELFRQMDADEAADAKG